MALKPCLIYIAAVLSLFGCANSEPLEQVAKQDTHSMNDVFFADVSQITPRAEGFASENVQAQCQRETDDNKPKVLLSLLCQLSETELNQLAIYIAPIQSELDAGENTGLSLRSHLIESAKQLAIKVMNKPVSAFAVSQLKSHLVSENGAVYLHLTLVSYDGSEVLAAHSRRLDSE